MGFEGGERKLRDKNEETEHLVQDTFLCFVFCLIPQPSVSTPSILTLPKVAKLLEERNGETSQDISQLFLSSAVGRRIGHLMAMRRPDDDSS